MKESALHTVLLITATALICASFSVACTQKKPEPEQPLSVENPAPEKTAVRVLPPADPRPNVVILMIDTLRADRMSAYGYDEDTTPELDVMAEKGIRFQRVIAQTSWTRPSIASFITGCYPRTVGIYIEPDQILPSSFVTLAEAMKKLQYCTAGIHSNPNINTYFNFQQGFDIFEGSELAYNFMHPGEGQKRFHGNAVASGEELFSRAFKQIENGQITHPCYMQFLLMDVHEWYRGKYDLTRDEYDGMFSAKREHKYLAPLRQLSHDIDVFVKKLIAMPGWENTLFVITADHGEGLYSHPDVWKSTWHGRLLYESQLVVPMIWWNPAWNIEGYEITRPVRLMDFMPTLINYLGGEIPQGVQGVSVLPLFENPDAPVDLPAMFVAETELRNQNKAAVYGKEWNWFGNYDHHKGMAPQELQAVGGGEDGARTNHLQEHPETAEAMAAWLETWKKNYPKSEPVAPSSELPKEMEDQLRAIGYLGG